MSLLGGCSFPACLAKTRLRVVGGLYVSWIFGGSGEFTLGEQNRGAKNSMVWRYVVRLLLCVLVVMAFSQTQVFAKEKAVVCAKYRTSSGWSNAYKVEAIILKGHELNQATSSLTYQGFDTYVVIFWDKDAASVIQMESAFVTFMEQTGYDQQGRAWQIKKGSVCF